jgi:hypothetical protein
MMRRDPNCPTSVRCIDGVNTPYRVFRRPSIFLPLRLKNIYPEIQEYEHFRMCRRVRKGSNG